MDTFVAWCGFFGAWLLVAGPMYQGALELHEQQFDRSAIVTQSMTIPHPKRVSPWWWLLPPVAIVLIRRTQGSWQREVMASLTAQQREEFITYSNKSVGWFIVGSGAALIGIKEAFELVEVMEWPEWSTLILCVVAAALGLTYTVQRMRRAEDALHQEH
ncbi:hypothetical protein AAFP30_05385 [Gordonia sp. CPCC 205515]|uniref:hypothetical protein n=1 Tax=Gordonia sp. CPCC 205515 TaxID=3140791 RepID=UPI003AF34A13